MECPFRELHELYKIVYDKAEAHAKAEKERQEKEKQEQILNLINYVSNNKFQHEPFEPDNAQNTEIDKKCSDVFDQEVLEFLQQNSNNTKKDLK